MNPFRVVDSRMDGRRAYRAAQTKDIILQVLFYFFIPKYIRNGHKAIPRLVTVAYIQIGRQGQIHRYIDRQVGRQVDRQEVDRQTATREKMNPFLVVDSRTDGRRAYRAAQTKDIILQVLFYFLILKYIRKGHKTRPCLVSVAYIQIGRQGQIDRQIHRQVGRQIGRQEDVNRQIDRQIGRQIDRRQIDRQTATKETMNPFVVQIVVWIVVALTGRLRRKILFCKFRTIFAGIQNSLRSKRETRFSL